MTAEVFVVPHEDIIMLYAPLKGVVAKTNEATVALLRDIQTKAIFKLTPVQEAVLASFESVGIVNGLPDLRLKIHDESAYAPIHVTLFLTNACNLRCVYCYASGGDSPKPTQIPMDAAKAGIDFVASNALATNSGAFSVGFHGAGEPTLAWSRYTALVEYARNKGKELGLRVSCATCTNAVMSEAHARWIARHTDTATVSADGLPYLHDALRPKADGGGSFEYLKRTLHIFDEEGFFYAIRATITDRNVRSMAEMVKFFGEHFRVGDLQFDPLIPAGRCAVSGCKGPDDATYISEYIRAYSTARALNRMVGFSCLSFTALKSFYCCAVSDGFTVTHDGLVTACFEASDLEHPFASRFIYGRYNPVTGAFDLDRMKLQALQARHVYNLPYCKDCFCKYMCSGDCPMHSLKVLGTMERGVRCNITQAIAKHRLATVVREAMPDAVVSLCSQSKGALSHG